MCGPAQFGEVRNKIANDLACDPRSEAPCDLVYDDELGPIPDFTVVPSGYSTDFNTKTDLTPESVARPQAQDAEPVDDALRPRLRRGTRLFRYLRYALSLDGK